MFRFITPRFTRRSPAVISDSTRDVAGRRIDLNRFHSALNRRLWFDY